MLVAIEFYNVTEWKFVGLIEGSWLKDVSYSPMDAFQKHNKTAQNILSFLKY